MFSHPVAAGNRRCGTEGQDKGAQIDSGGQFEGRSLVEGQRDAVLAWIKRQEDADIDWQHVTTMGFRNDRYDAEVPCDIRLSRATKARNVRFGSRLFQNARCFFPMTSCRCGWSIFRFYEFVLLMRSSGPEFAVCVSDWSGVRAKSCIREPYAAFIAAISGAMPRIFMTRLRL